MKRTRDGVDTWRRGRGVFNISLLTLQRPTLTHFNVHACPCPLAGTARGHKHPLRAKRGRKRGGARNGANAPRYTPREARCMPHWVACRMVYCPKGERTRTTKESRFSALIAGRTRTTGAGRNAAPPTAAHRSGVSREEMKKACEARREARRESLPLSRRGAGKPTVGGQTAARSGRRRGAQPASTPTG